MNTTWIPLALVALAFSACEPLTTPDPAPTPTYSSSSGASAPSGGPVYVHGYTRANGTYVQPYTRRR